MVTIFSFLRSSLFRKRCMFYLVCSVFLNWVCWVRGNFSGEPGHVYISCVCVSAVWSAGPVQVNLGMPWSGRRDYTGSPFLWLCCSGYGTVEMMKGVVRIFFAFFSLLSVLLAVGCLR
jgi:hypothetical protein